ncbi:PIG-L family deacetylase [Paenibacillus chitinolyticus]|uniref:PIG-L family deacetylase n=1 Tax=Paenibacillus chitinolyticus TaxID=79263 RepID=A0A410X276_9BACL|nr:PIG-L deacetylase family protein [Paenibacillus chitinolyticus]MCY9593541.1 PIG-L family deacetylase [Paenibacillus chitinolyticus]MCY9597512.1 PIG-L family deacetylase [Paenibacillus chitinolyticus]QAV20709.1 PIG-L family deacetylase [Paenibacillus chitinolyticus]
MRKTLLFVFAHPDDESFACGGTMAKYAESGHAVHLACATSGCKGKTGEYTFTCREEIAVYREGELRRAAAVLGVERVHFYRYPDGDLAEVREDLLAARVAATILDLQPHLVVTFPPDGVTGHPDHIAISKAVLRAVKELDAEGGAAPDLYYASIPNYYDHCGDCGPSECCPITARVNISEFRSRKGEALQAHKSQVYSVDRAYPGVMHGDYSVIGPYEYFTLVRRGGQSTGLNKCAGEIPVVELV